MKTNFGTSGPCLRRKKVRAGRNRGRGRKGGEERGRGREPQGGREEGRESRETEGETHRHSESLRDSKRGRPKPGVPGEIN